MGDAIPPDFAYLKDLRRDRHVKVRCRRCGYRGEVGTSRILRRFSGYMPFLQLRRHFRCLECHAKREVDLDGSDALSQ
jgi:hypothetical protein